MFNRKEEVFSIKEFMARNKKETVIPVKESRFEYKNETIESLSVLGGLSLIPLAMRPITQAIPVSASMTSPVYSSQAVPSTGEMTAKLMHAFDPLISLIQAVAYPIALVVVLGGAIMVMMRNPEKGFSMMQSAGLGYILVQMAPMVLNILVEATKLM